ncbi:hypothetical protein F7734_27890 [Scytonema sp. UIC 10036]|uniref:hypothetical protein n=1 Tax=Scytonema sp. UIC 10036 TaxID=2304196 RepID=UPI0012DA3D02|nr:hypothetical protein [Scytonema sp. UIC 10036]MUG95966.1 hypothetical protein [Scytonema sp. UIC 10036]
MQSRKAAKKRKSMRKNFWLVLVLVILSALFIGCFNFGNNYNNEDGQKPPLKEIGNWLGLPLPNNYSDLKYKIIADTPDPNVEIAVKVPEDFFQSLIKSQNLVNYDKFKDKLSYDIKPRELSNTDASHSIIKKPQPNTTIWITQNQYYPRYLWYQDSTLYLVYFSQ